MVIWWRSITLSGDGAVAYVKSLQGLMGGRMFSGQEHVLEEPSWMFLYQFSRWSENCRCIAVAGRECPSPTVVHPHDEVLQSASCCVARPAHSLVGDMPLLQGATFQGNGKWCWRIYSRVVCRYLLTGPPPSNMASSLVWKRRMRHAQHLFPECAFLMLDFRSGISSTLRIGSRGYFWQRAKYVHGNKLQNAGAREAF